MKDQKLTYSFHNPNTDKETEKMLLQAFSQSLFKQVCNQLMSESDDLKDIVESETHFFTDQDWFEYIRVYDRYDRVEHNKRIGSTG